eukprot:7692939-Pyramimonas_sp.AAC.1
MPQLRAAAHQYPRRAAIGADRFGPRHWAYVYIMGRWLLLGLCCISAKSLGTGQASVGGCMRRCSRGPMGGFRPIALLASVYRLWSQA